MRGRPIRRWGGRAGARRVRGRRGPALAASPRIKRQRQSRAGRAERRRGAERHGPLRRGPLRERRGLDGYGAAGPRCGGERGGGAASPLSRDRLRGGESLRWPVRCWGRLWLLAEPVSPPVSLPVSRCLFARSGLGRCSCQQQRSVHEAGGGRRLCCCVPPHTPANSQPCSVQPSAPATRNKGTWLQVPAWSSVAGGQRRGHVTRERDSKPLQERIWEAGSHVDLADPLSDPWQRLA